MRSSRRLYLRRRPSALRLLRRESMPLWVGHHLVDRANVEVVYAKVHFRCDEISPPEEEVSSVSTSAIAPSEVLDVEVEEYQSGRVSI